MIFIDNKNFVTTWNAFTYGLSDTKVRILQLQRRYCTRLISDQFRLFFYSHTLIYKTIYDVMLSPLISNFFQTFFVVKKKSYNWKPSEIHLINHKLKLSLIFFLTFIITVILTFVSLLSPLYLNVFFLKWFCEKNNRWFSEW